MINTGLDRTYTAKEGGQPNYDPIPEGEYKLRVKDIDPWKAVKKTIKVIQKDENGNVLKDANGNNVTETQECEFYNSIAKLEVVGGEYDGRIIFHNLTTHPNMDWNIPNFLWGLGLKDVQASQIQTICKGKECYAHVYIDSYDKTVQNKETGIDETVEKLVNRIQSFKPLENPNNVSESLTDINLGI